MLPTILITRPEPLASQFVDRLRARLGCGSPIVISPVLQVETLDDLPDLKDVRTLIFTSRNGVSTFARSSENREIPCYCVGDATARDARDLGLKAVSCAGGADELVTRMIADRVAGPCLHIRGEHSTGDVSSRLMAAGIETSQSILYRQTPLAMSDAAKALLQGDAPVILPLFSPRTAKLFFSAINVSAPVSILALSRNVANEVPERFTKQVQVAQKPDAETIMNLIEEVIRSGKLLEAGKRAQ